MLVWVSVSVAAQTRPTCLSRDGKTRAELIGTGQAVVAAAVVDLFEKNDAHGSLADQARFGETLKVLPQTASCVGAQSRFVWVETAARYRGYANMSDLVPWPKDRPPYLAKPQQARVRVVSRLAFVYRTPDAAQALPSLALPVHTEAVLAEAVSPRWLKILLPDGPFGFVQQGDVEKQAVFSATADCVLLAARKYEGTPYLWGGRSTLGIDCSGLVANAFSACGVTAPRDAGPQMDWVAVSPVFSKNELRAGDLLFFRGQDPTEAASQVVKHVGLYTGRGRFFHATTSETPTVHESSLAAPEWQRRYLGARRYRGF